MFKTEIMDFIYVQNLECRIIKYLAKVKNLEIRDAMDIYYRSNLAMEIEQGLFGLENMDYKYLTEDLIENEPALFEIL